MKKYLIHLLIIAIIIINFSIPKEVKAVDGYCFDKYGNFLINGRTNDTDCGKKPGGILVSSKPTCSTFAQFSSLGVCQKIADILETASAEGTIQNSNYKFLAPLPCEKGSPGCPDGKLIDFDPTVERPLGVYLNIMIRILFGISAVLAVVMIVMGGIEYMTSELAHTKESGKERIQNALLGLVLAFGAYSILYTINPDLLRTDIEISPVQINVDLSLDQPQEPVNGKYTDRSGQVYDTTNAASLDWTQRAGPITTLPSGVSVYNSQCTQVGQSNCTSTRGLNLSVINAILSNCKNCTTLSIQGGTEFWLHGKTTTHQINSPTVDLGVSDALTQYITDGKKLVPYQWYQKDGLWYYWEINHWHASGNNKG